MSSLTPVALPLPQNPKPNFAWHDSLFTALASSTTLSHLKQVHAQILRSRIDRSNSLFLKLVLTSCALSSGLDYAISVFCQIRNPETHFCNKVLRELSRGAKPEKTLLVYEKMRRDGSSLDRFSFPPLLRGVSKASALNEGLEIHGLASKLGFDSDPFIQTGLIGMYAACGQIIEARLLFDKMSHRDVVTWNIMIDGYGLVCCLFAFSFARAFISLNFMLNNPGEECFSSFTILPLSLFFRSFLFLSMASQNVTSSPFPFHRCHELVFRPFLTREARRN